MIRPYHAPSKQKAYTPTRIVYDSPMTWFDCELCGAKDSTKTTLMAERTATKRMTGLAALLCVACYLRACRRVLTPAEIKTIKANANVE